MEKNAITGSEDMIMFSSAGFYPVFDKPYPMMERTGKEWGFDNKCGMNQEVNVLSSRTKTEAFNAPVFLPTGPLSQNAV